MTDLPNTKKWACEYCTFKNWPAAKKCTLCRAPKPIQLISEGSEQVGQDIYKIAPLISDRTSPNSGSSTTGKWPCSACTYLNWPRAVKCTQCMTPRAKVSLSLVPSAQSHDLTSPLSINVNIEESPGSSPSSRKSSPNSPEAAKAINNDKNRAVAAGSGGSGTVSCASIAKIEKWTCKACTYSNWPRAQKCVMCGTSKGRTTPELSPSATDNSSINTNYFDSNHDNVNSRSRQVISPGLLPRRSEVSELPQSIGATASPVIYSDNRTDERRIKQIRNRIRDSDWLWLNACRGIVDGDIHAIESYLAMNGDPSRQLTQDEVKLLNRPSAFEIGYTLVHLAIRFQREDMLTVLLTATDVAAKSKKRVPCHVCPDIAADIMRDISLSLRQRKGDFPCYFVTEAVTFALPAEIEDLPHPIQKQLFDEILDRDVQKELEVEEPVINWSVEITERLGSKLYALWNRTAGDCLLDSVLQATWGVFDRDNTLRRALSDSMNEGANTLYPRWKETETRQAELLQFSLDEGQWQQDWTILLNLASQPGASLEQIHIFTLAHILRRPVIVYGIKFVKSYHGDNIGFARFQGVYLPLLWEQSFCWKTPIALAYTRGHFSALVSIEIDSDENIGAGANIENTEEGHIAFLPLTDSEGKLLPVHFLTGSQMNKEEIILREWLDCCVTEGGLLVAQQKVNKLTPHVGHMVDEWLDRYRRLAHVVKPSVNRGQQVQSQQPQLEVYSSEEETDDE